MTFGTPNFVAPEAVLHSKYYRETDYYALAALIMQIWFVSDVETYKAFNLDKITEILNSCQDQSIVDGSTNWYVFCRFYARGVFNMRKVNYNERPSGIQIREWIFNTTRDVSMYLAEQADNIRGLMQKAESIEDKTAYSLKVFNRDVMNFLVTMLTHKSPFMLQHPTYMKHFLTTNRAFFHAFDDKGQSLLGLDVDSILTNNIPENLAQRPADQIQKKKLVI